MLDGFFFIHLEKRVIVPSTLKICSLSTRENMQPHLGLRADLKAPRSMRQTLAIL